MRRFLVRACRTFSLEVGPLAALVVLGLAPHTPGGDGIFLAQVTLGQTNGAPVAAPLAEGRDPVKPVPWVVAPNDAE